MELGDRLSAVLRMVKPADVIADIGCDHGYIAIELIRRQIATHVIAADVHKGPLQRAEENIRIYGCENYITTRLSDGLSAFQEGEVDGMVCAGMGGRLLMDILCRDLHKTKQIKQFVLQPQSELFWFRQTLRAQGFMISQEDMVYEAGKYYPMMSVNVGATNVANVTKQEQELADCYGGHLLQNRHPVLLQFLEAEEQQLMLLLREVENSTSSERGSKRREELSIRLQRNRLAKSYYA